MPHAVIQRTHGSRRNLRHPALQRIHPAGRREERGGGPSGPPLLEPHLNVTLSTASLILFTITSASSVPCFPLKPFIAATIPTINSDTSRIRPTYSTVPCPRSPNASERIARSRTSIAACTYPISA